MNNEKVQEAAYPALLMWVLEEATTKNNFELTVKNGMFELRNHADDYHNPIFLTQSYCSDSYNALEDLESNLKVRTIEREEQLRHKAAKAAALSKLSEEERELLSL